MKLWVITPRTDLEYANDPWEPWYDKAFGFVIRAETEEAARQLAQSNSGDESTGEYCYEKKNYSTRTPWLNRDQSSCVELTPSGKEEIVLRDFAAA